MKCLLIATLVGIALAAPPKDANLRIPSYVKTCARNQPDVNNCLKGAIQDIFPYLTKGIKELNLPPIDPLHIEESFYEFGQGSIRGKTIVRNAYAYGLGDATIKEVRTNFEDTNNIVIETELYIPKTRLEGFFKQQGQLIGVQLNGNGKFNITGEDVNMTWKLTGALQGRNGAKYLKIKQFLVTPRFGNMFIEATNLIDGNEAVSKTIVALVNQHWRATYDEMLPFTQEVWDKLFREFANRMFSRVPFDEIFPTS